MDEILFPHDKVRDIQDTVISDVYEAIKDKKDIIIHAPTGIGKTASVLAPALSFAMDKDITVFTISAKSSVEIILSIETLSTLLVISVAT